MQIESYTIINNSEVSSRLGGASPTPAHEFVQYGASETHSH